jgi:hypothetical protein
MVVNFNGEEFLVWIIFLKPNNQILVLSNSLAPSSYSLISVSLSKLIISLLKFIALWCIMNTYIRKSWSKQLKCALHCEGRTDINNYSKHPLSLSAKRVMKMTLGKEEKTKASSPLPLPYILIPTPRSQYQRLPHHCFKTKKEAKFSGLQSFHIPHQR